MHAEKVSEIIAHFIGLFETLTDEIRMRLSYREGQVPADEEDDVSDEAQPSDDFTSDFTLGDYDPGVNYAAGHYSYNFLVMRNYAQTFQESIEKLAEINAQASLLHHRPEFGTGNDYDYVEMPGKLPDLVVHTGPGSAVGHVLQVNVLRDDDYLNMTDGPDHFRDTSFVVERLAEFNTHAEIFAPFSALEKPESDEGMMKIADEIHGYSQDLQQETNGESTSLGTGAEVDFVLAASQLDGRIYVNGELVEDAPSLTDFLPDRGIAKPEGEPDDSQSLVHHGGGSGDSLIVEAGANMVTNIVGIVDTGIMASVTAVMGDYHQVDVISQVYVYSDRDEINSVLTDNSDSTHDSATVGMNVAMFERSIYDPGVQHDATDADGGPIFPTAWRVSVVEGDVSFVHWVEQYNFVTDNDTMKVMNQGSEISVLTGGNEVVNLASYLGYGMQYDLVIVGGNALDMNVITQISILYDNDWVRSGNGTGQMEVQTGNNLLWNMASIHNVGGQDRFQDMPDYMRDTADNIDDRVPVMPKGLAADHNFAGYEALNILYITGNLYDVNVVKQVSILGDSDDVAHVANKLLEENPHATVTIDTGSNTVANVAQIIDYDSFGQTTYVAGQVYSDAILIQGGLVEHDASQPEHPSDRLANEVIAFLGDDTPHNGDGVIDTGHDQSWANGQVTDVMQTVVA